MTDSWSAVSEILAEAVALKDPSERKAWLRKRCGDDVELMEEVLSLLENYDGAGDFLEEGGNGIVGFEQLGPYRLGEVLGEGGMGIVYEAERVDEVHTERVAIKILKKGMDTREVVRRFQLERRILARLDHPNIARLLDGGTTPDGRPYFVMDLVQGENLVTYCTSNRLSLEARLNLFLKISSAVEYAHQNLIVHRDLKASNIVIDEAGEPKLLDFGIAKLLESDLESAKTRTGLRPLTPSHSSPEQFLGEAVTTATDVYGLGLLLYEILVGLSPQKSDSTSWKTLYEKICLEDATRPSTAALKAGVEISGLGTADGVAKFLKGDLDEIILYCLRKDPRERYASASELSMDITRYLEGFPIGIRRSSRGYRFRKFFHRHRWATATVAIFALVVGAFVTNWVAQNRRVVESQVRAEQTATFMVDLFEDTDPFEDHGSDLTVRTLLDRGVERLRDGRLDENPEVKAELMRTVARTYVNLSEFDVASSLLEESMGLTLELEGEKSLLHAEGLADRGNLDYFQGDLEGAELDLDTARNILLELGATEGEQYAGVLNDLGAILRFRDKMDQVEPYHREALRIRKKVHGYDHRLVAESTENLGSFYIAQEKPQEAIALFEEALAIKERIGASGSNRARSLNNVGRALMGLGEFEQAEDYLNRALVLAKEGLGEEHQLSYIILGNLGAALLMQGQFDTAEPHLRKTLSLTEKLHGKEHPEYAIGLNNLASVERRLGDYAEAEVHWMEALVIADKLGFPPANLGKMLLNVAANRTESGDPTGAMEYFSQAEDLILSSFGDESWQMALVDRGLGEHFAIQGKDDEARKAYRKAYDRFLKEMGPENMEVQRLLSSWEKWYPGEEIGE